MSRTLSFVYVCVCVWCVYESVVTDSEIELRSQTVRRRGVTFASCALMVPKASNAKPTSSAYGSRGLKNAHSSAKANWIVRKYRIRDSAAIQLKVLLYPFPRRVVCEFMIYPKHTAAGQVGPLKSHGRIRHHRRDWQDWTADSPNPRPKLRQHGQSLRAVTEEIGVPVPQHR